MLMRNDRVRSGTSLRQHYLDQVKGCILRSGEPAYALSSAPPLAPCHSYVVERLNLPRHVR